MGKRGKFIVLEGVDGSGITTQTGLLKNWFQENPAVAGRTFFTKEPTDGPVGGLIRLFLSKRLKKLDERIMALLFAADRLDHLNLSGLEGQSDGIINLLNKDINVVSDRYYLSSYAYQSLEVDLEWLLQINRFALKPDLILYLQIPIDTSVERRNRSRFHEELYEKETTLTRISKNYEEVALKLKEKGENIAIIDGSRHPDEVFNEIKQLVINLMSKS